jgi:hypothetical protein
MPGVFQFDNESDWRVIRLFFSPDETWMFCAALRHFATDG